MRFEKNIPILLWFDFSCQNSLLQRRYGKWWIISKHKIISYVGTYQLDNRNINFYLGWVKSWDSWKIIRILYYIHTRKKFGEETRIELHLSNKINEQITTNYQVQVSTVFYGSLSWELEKEEWWWFYADNNSTRRWWVRRRGTDGKYVHVFFPFSSTFFLLSLFQATFTNVFCKYIQYKF